MSSTGHRSSNTKTGGTKNGYPTLELAKKAANTRGAQIGAWLIAYKCRECDKYHYGHWNRPVTFRGVHDVLMHIELGKRVVGCLRFENDASFDGWTRAIADRCAAAEKRRVR